MKIKIVCREENFTKYRNMLESIGFEISDEANLLLKELDFVQNRFYARDSKNNLVVIDIDQVYLIESFGNITELKTENCTYRISEKLYEIAEKYAVKGFIRINKSQIVNLTKIEKVSPQFNSTMKIFLKNLKIVYVSRSYITNFKDSLDIGGKEW